MLERNENVSIILRVDSAIGLKLTACAKQEAEVG